MFLDVYIFEIQDQLGYRMFNWKCDGNFKNDVGLFKYVEVDYVVLQGFMLIEMFGVLWEDIFCVFYECGMKVILLSVVFFYYMEREINFVFCVFEKYFLVFIFMRDW